MADIEDERLTQKKSLLNEAVPFLKGKDLAWSQLFGGLAHVTFLVTTADGDRYVVKFLTQEMDDFGLMIPIVDLVRNTIAAGNSGVGARVLHSMVDVPAIVLEYIDGVTLTPADLSLPHNIPRLGSAVRELHQGASRMNNEIDIFKFLNDYLHLVKKFELTTPDGLLDSLPVIRRIEKALAYNLMTPVPSNNDLLARNVMDDGRIRLIDYDFSGMNDPMFDVGDLAMEGDYNADQTARLCEAYFGHTDHVQYARARLYGICAQYTWALLFLGMGALLSDMPDQTFDYYAEAESRWKWTGIKLDADDLAEIIAAASS